MTYDEAMEAVHKIGVLIRREAWHRSVVGTKNTFWDTYDCWFMGGGSPSSNEEMMCWSYQALVKAHSDEPFFWSYKLYKPTKRDMQADDWVIDK